MFDRINQGIYWDRLWKIVDGCSPASAGCERCWSARYAHRFDHENPRLTKDNGEWSGEIRRGYFLDGLSGVQFATDEALRLLEKINSNELSLKKAPYLISTIDPALPFGGQLEWSLADAHQEKIAITRSGSNHIYFVGAEPVVYLENFALRLFLTNRANDKALMDFPHLIKNWLRFPEPLRPRKKIDIAQINGLPAAKHELSSLFQDSGFEIDGDGLVLWPSNL